MLALGVFFLTLGEFLIYVAFGWWLWAGNDWAIWEVLLLALAIAFVIRAAITAYSFAVTEYYKSPRPPDAQLGPISAAGLFLRELLALSSLYTTVHTLDRWLGLPDPKVKPDDDRPPVLLLHGFFCNSSFWWILRRQLFRASYDNVFTQTLEPVFGDIEHLADRLAEKIDAILEATHARRVIVVGHSMGGLVPRAYMRRYGADKVLKLIAVGTPHHGTQHGKAAAWMGENIRQMRYQSRWLKELNSLPLPVPITNIYSYHDNIVAPQNSSALAGAKNIALAGIGHLEMAIMPKVRQLILEEIRVIGDTAEIAP